MELSYEEYLKLIQEVNRYRNEIHLFNTESISEAALDELKHKITEYETRYPQKLSPNSPNYTIAGGVLDKFEKFTHRRRMLSLNDIFSLEELTEWNQRWIDFVQKNTTYEANPKGYICEPKIDGLALSLHYKQGILETAVTRGDGFVGENVTENVKQIRAIPKFIDFQGWLEVRGEVFLTKKDFESMNEEIRSGQKVGRMGKFGPENTFANPRNAASGTLRQLNSSIVAGRNLSFIAYGAYIYEP